VFTFDFIDLNSQPRLELMNTTDQTLKRVEVLTVFLKDETTHGGPSLTHIRFEAVELIKPQEKVVVRHRTWGNGKPTTIENDQLKQLTLVEGRITPYVLDISWQDHEGKMQFQRIPVGH